MAVAVPSSLQQRDPCGQGCQECQANCEECAGQAIDALDCAGMKDIVEDCEIGVLPSGGICNASLCFAGVSNLRFSVGSQTEKQTTNTGLDGTIVFFGELAALAELKGNKWLLRGGLLTA